MTHDPLCQYDETRDSPCDWCDLIARVREDERGKDELIVANAWNAGYAAALRDAVDAVKAAQMKYRTVSEWMYDYNLRKQETVPPYGEILTRSDAVAAIEALRKEQS